MSKVIVYSLENCPHCEELKDLLKNNKIKYEERDLNTAENLTTLRINGVFVAEAPVLNVGDIYLESKDMFVTGDIQEEKIMKLVK